MQYREGSICKQQKANERYKVNETFPDLETETAEIVKTLLQNPYWLSGKDVTHVWSRTRQRIQWQSAKCKELEIKGIKVIKSYWSAHELEGESEADHTLTLYRVLADMCITI